MIADEQWVLVSVCDREILVEVFDTYEEARETRDREMIEWASVPDDVFGKDEYEESDFGYGGYQAWANDRSDYDWLIFCL